MRFIGRILALYESFNKTSFFLLRKQLLFHTSQGLPLGSEYLLLLNPDFIFEIVRLYLQYASDKVNTCFHRVISYTTLVNKNCLHTEMPEFHFQPIDSGQTMPEPLKKSQTILQPVIRSCPGSVEAIYLMGKLKYLTSMPPMIVEEQKS